MRIVILAHDMPESNIIVGRFVKHLHASVVGIVRSEILIAGKSTLECYRYLYQRAGCRLLFQKGLEGTICTASGMLQRMARRRPYVQPLRRLAREHRIPSVSAMNVHHRDVLDQVRSWGPDLLVSVYVFQVIKQPLLEISRLGAINFHPALLPCNRGLMPYVWALSNGDLWTGGTVHWIDERLDTGDVILQSSFPIRDEDTVFSIAFRSAALGGDMLVEATRRIESGDANSVRQNHEASSYYSWPDRGCMKRLRDRGRKWGAWGEMWRCFLQGTMLQPPECEEM